jgi:hypothetical protein
MATLYNVRVRPDYRWAKARVGGREFGKASEVMNAAYLTEEMMTSPLLEIEAVEDPTPESIEDPADEEADDDPD